MKNGPEERYEDRKIWEEERRMEHPEEELTDEDIYDIECDDKYESDGNR